MKSKLMIWAVAILFLAVILTIAGAICKVYVKPIARPLLIIGCISQLVSTICLVIYGLTTKKREQT